ncbi:hypothetical protein HDK90DRAFT_214217 [Phyllosticta capitalensis]|uniref:RNA helicase n=1 Tax=Phyllosticta capitalensis TaxID=121624 RepID=A0ABR1YT15_9PEZI
MPSHSSAHSSRHHSHRSRSRSPHASSRHRQHRTRSHSPHRRHHHRSHHDSRVEKSSRDRHGRNRSPSGSLAPPKAVSLPLNARTLSKHDYAAYRPMFALYLDIQKQKILEDMDETEVKGRWKSFVGKWNRGELAEGWYDPSTLQKAIDSSPDTEEAGAHAAKARSPDQTRRASPDYGVGRAAAAATTTSAPHVQENGPDADEESEDEFGPAAMPGQVSTGVTRVGPAVPRLDDLELQRESREEEQEARIEALRAARKADRALQKERLEELVPRAEPGSRERQLEKKMDKTAMVRSFREAKSPGAEDVRESDLMGDDVDALKARKREEERRKSERELRREEIMRAKAAEREERIAEYRSQEDSTMQMLQALAKQRFGGGA